jgi:hypothetical protein
MGPDGFVESVDANGRRWAVFASGAKRLDQDTE